MVTNGIPGRWSRPSVVPIPTAALLIGTGRRKRTMEKVREAHKQYEEAEGDYVFIPFWVASLLLCAFFIGGFLLGYIGANWGVQCR